MESMFVYDSYAKINLSLQIEGVRSTDGYHLLDTVTASVGIFDTLEFRDFGCGEICTEFFSDASGAFPTIDCSAIPRENNTCYKALKLMDEEFGFGGVRVRITKRIPIGGGLGGSSADAAGAIAALARRLDLSHTDPTIKRIALQCGADTPCMLSKGFQRVKGTGEILQKIESSLRLYCVIAMGKRGVDTKACYQKYDSLPIKTPMTDNNFLQTALSADKIPNHILLSNSLATPAMLLNAEIGNTLKHIQETVPLGCGMSGSGAGCFGIYATEKAAEQAAAALREKCAYAVSCMCGNIV